MNLRSYAPSTSTMVIVMLTALVVWFVYWNLNWFMAIPRPGIPTHSTLPMLELSPLGMTLFGTLAGLVGAAAALTRVEHKAEKAGLVTGLLLLCCAYILIFLKYGVMFPLQYLDFVFTFLFVGIIVVVVFVAALMLSKLLRDYMNGLRSRNV